MHAGGDGAGAGAERALRGRQSCAYVVPPPVTGGVFYQLKVRPHRATIAAAGAPFNLCYRTKGVLKRKNNTEHAWLPRRQSELA